MTFDSGASVTGFLEKIQFKTGLPNMIRLKAQTWEIIRILSLNPGLPNWPLCPPELCIIAILPDTKRDRSSRLENRKKKMRRKKERRNTITKE